MISLTVISVYSLSQSLQTAQHCSANGGELSTTQNLILTVQPQQEYSNLKFLPEYIRSESRRPTRQYVFPEVEFLI